MFHLNCVLFWKARGEERGVSKIAHKNAGNVFDFGVGYDIIS